MSASEAIRDIRVTVSGWLNMHHGGREVSSWILLRLFFIERENVALREENERLRSREPREP